MLWQSKGYRENPKTNHWYCQCYWFSEDENQMICEASRNYKLRDNAMKAVEAWESRLLMIPGKLKACIHYIIPDEI